MAERKIKTHYSEVLVTVNVENVLSRDVLAHEVPILKILNGENRIAVNVEKLPYKAPEGTSREILVHLRKKYANRRNADGDNPVDLAYPDGSRDIERFYDGTYTPETRDLEQPSFSESNDSEEEGTTDSGVALASTVDRQKILDQLEILGIPHSKHTPTTKLKALLDSIETTDGAE